MVPGDVFNNHIFNKFAHAVFDENFQLSFASDNFAQLTQTDATSIKPNITLFELFDEFVGAEVEILNLVNKPDGFYPLNRINRPILGTRNHLTYINLVVRPMPEELSYMLIVEDVTDEGTLEQRLTQTRNELELATQQLQEKNEKLQQTNDRLVRVNQLKEIFFSMVAHDLRAPLTIIAGYSNLLKNVLEKIQEVIRDSALEHIETILSQCRWLDNSINNLLDLHKIDSDQLILECETYDLYDIVSETVSHLEWMANLPKVTLSLESPDEPIYVYADKKRISQVFQNLITNAIKYNEPEIGRVDVSVQSNPESGEAEVVVADTGNGMTEGQLKNAFKLYYRSENAENSSVKGTGVGLYIVKMLVEAHNGRIEVNSILREGTTFRIFLKQVKKEL